MGIIHPHLNPLPSRERKIKEKVFHREREILRNKSPRSFKRRGSSIHGIPQSNYYDGCKNIFTRPV
jgi:hypothetical protein